MQLRHHLDDVGCNFQRVSRWRGIEADHHGFFAIGHRTIDIVVFLETDFGNITQTDNGAITAGDDQFFQIGDIVDLRLGIGVIQREVTGGLAW